ncbi:hypothetical protein GCM10022226_15570 [Sphaerisporangium flaviroseum]|uniref:SIR2-like domain-containing protein n=1 Tax=Sphaerisporangium flaviroseum TaxID=509199 RepID=A0ABP7HM52_9ACTN
MDDADWRRLIHQLRQGDCTPMLGAGAVAGTVPTAGMIADVLAHRYGYPFTDTWNLARVTEYASVISRDSIDVKEEFRALVSRDVPDFNDPNDVHGLLAEFPIPLFITTNYDNFMQDALLLRGKLPTSVIPPWYEEVPRRPTELERYSPSVEQPLVYHLHGSMSSPESLVLTESDYLEYLVKLTEERVTGGSTLVPLPVLHALTAKPVFFIGYSLNDWTFRFLFHGLLRSLSRAQRRRNISVMLAPLHSSEAGEEEARTFVLRDLERFNVSIYWGTVTDFCKELRLKIGSYP